MKTLITTGIFAASLALLGTTAMAAPSQANPVPRYAQSWQNRAPVRVAARGPVFGGPLNVDVARFVGGMLGGGPVPYANLVRDVRGLRSSGGGSYDFSSSPSYDNSAATASSAAADAQAASDAEVQAIQQMNDTNALTASMAAAEQQNEAANAATLQTEINAGM